jgi:hypothetical protein
MFDPALGNAIPPKGNHRMITVIDYGMGNLRSVVKAFEH